MYALLIREHTHWHDHWSVMIGEKLSVKDSSNDLFIFSPAHSAQEIKAVLEGVPQEFYRLFKVNEAPEEECDYRADSGTCYIAAD